MASLQCSWIKRLYNDSFQKWKLISLKLIKKSFGDELKFHSNLSLNNSYVSHFPCFYKNILLKWKQYLSTDPATIPGLFSQNEKMAKKIYSILISSLKNKPTSESYFENSFPNYTFDWKQIYLLPQIFVFVFLLLFCCYRCCF